jgi:pimeloyl-ACP methyl ester carboxylesterase
MLKYEIDLAVTLVLRPPRSRYSIDELNYDLPGSLGRDELTITTPSGCAMPGSLFRAANPAPGNPVVIFSHGNAMDQSAVFTFIDTDRLFEMGLSLCSFDFAGCGQGTEPLITLGWRERGELVAVIEHLRSTYGLEKVILWGLSMGAFTSFMTLAERTDITACVFDSGGSSIARALRSWVEGNETVYQAARQKIREEAGFDVEELDAVAVAPSVKIPVFFIHAVSDLSDTDTSSKRIFEALGSKKKEYIPFKGAHGGFRPEMIHDAVFRFLADALAEPSEE